MMSVSVVKSDTEIEQEIQDKGLTAPRVTPSVIESVIAAEDYHIFPGTQLTVCVLTLLNGFTVTGESACASPENFDIELGRKIAKTNATQKIWGLEGYLLKQNLFEADDNIERIAQVAHEINQAYCLALGDDSQLDWKDAPQWQKDSAIAGVKFHIANPDANTADSHDAWFKQKEEEGWILGPVKDAEAKTHPCMLPYEALPVEQKAKDFLFRQVIHSLYG